MSSTASDPVEKAGFKTPVGSWKPGLAGTAEESNARRRHLPQSTLARPSLAALGCPWLCLASRGVQDEAAYALGDERLCRHSAARKGAALATATVPGWWEPTPTRQSQTLCVFPPKSATGDATMFST